MKKIIIFTFLMLCATMNCFGNTYNTEVDRKFAAHLICENGKLFLVVVSAVGGIAVTQIMGETVGGLDPVRCK